MSADRSLIASWALIYMLCFISPQGTFAVDTITTTLSIQDGETIVSAQQHFELGFFGRGNTTKGYLGIWYKKIQPQTVVWVANRNNPVTDSAGVLRFASDGNLVVLNQKESIMWSSNVSKVVKAVVAQLLDTGNLVIQEEGGDPSKGYLWQSFDHPTDTMLAEMKFGWNTKTGLDWDLTSWRSTDDVSAGEYTYRIDHQRLPQGFILNGKSPIMRTGHWNGYQQNGFKNANTSPNYFYKWEFHSNQDEIYEKYVMKNESIYTRLVMDHTGVVQRYNWYNESRGWISYWYVPYDQCDSFMKCGANAYCDISKVPMCICLRGFKPKNAETWKLNDWSDGCIPITEFECQKNDGFLHLKNMKIPDNQLSFSDENMTLAECEVECRKNCSCKAYSNLYITNGGIGCIIWVDDLKDIRVFTEGSGQDFYVRVPASELDDGGTGSAPTNGDHERSSMLIIVVTVIPAILFLAACLIWKKRKKFKHMLNRVTKARDQHQVLPLSEVVNTKYTIEIKDDLELVLFNLTTIEEATNNFSDESFLGKGGFGSVYKGTLEDGPQIAVKRLSKNSNSGQGVEEFKTELMLIAKLQHRNLVRLLGSCVEGEERMLVYEYMENKSLDLFLFDRESGPCLDWERRCSIIEGIARGLLYLHQDSRFRIIHRDLKVSNILLDGEMNPKISDFGLARIFGGDQTEATTRRVVGTYGYMAPEYAMNGLFSVKSDVYSFGVLALEIVSGIKSNDFLGSNIQDNFLGHAWKLWTEGNALELTDESLGGLCPSSEVLKYTQVGLLCVQEQPKDRPTMSSVVAMLVSETMTLPQPNKPGNCLPET